MLLYLDYMDRGVQPQLGYKSTFEDTLSVIMNYKGNSLAQYLTNKGTVSVVLQSIGGHVNNYDRITKQNKAMYLESKMTSQIGTCSKISKEKAKENYVGTEAPPGALAYPRYGIYTNCNPMKNIESTQSPGHGTCCKQ